MKFKFLDEVKIIDGFYVGLTGKVTEHYRKSPYERQDIYRVEGYVQQEMCATEFSATVYEDDLILKEE